MQSMLTHMDNDISASQIVSDLVLIHQDRIDTYTQILRGSGKIELDMKAIYERIIEESSEYKRQLEEKLKPPSSGPGKIYKLWLMEKASVSGVDKKTILATCATDELVTNNTYSMALSLVTNEDIRTLLEEHQQGLKKLYDHIRQYHNAQ